MIDVTIVSDNPKDLDRIINATLKVEPYITFLDELKEKRKAWEFKNQYAARLSPFIVVNRGFKDYTTLYREVYDDPVEKLIDLLNSEIINENN